MGRCRAITLAALGWMWVGCARPAPAPSRPVVLEGFSDGTRAAVLSLLQQHGRGAPGFDPAHPPRATLDWDNTMVRNDVGDLSLFFALGNNRLLLPAAWEQLDPGLSPAAVAALQQACSPAGVPGDVLDTRGHPACVDVILGVYLDEKLADGTAAFALPDTPAVKRSYLFGARLWHGQTAEQISRTAKLAWDWGTHEPVGATTPLGQRVVPSWIRIHPPMAQLVEALQSHGVEVWIVSASGQHLVEAAAATVGIPAAHVLGVQLKADAKGRLQADLLPCGDDGVERMPFGQGKRCLINKSILHLPPPQQVPVAPSAQRPVLAAGDSDGDIPMLQDATLVRLALNRGRTELMCRALHNGDGKWWVEPLFVDPLPPRAEPFSCGGFSDDAGRPIADQPWPAASAVHAAPQP